MLNCYLIILLALLQILLSIICQLVIVLDNIHLYRLVNGQSKRLTFFQYLGFLLLDIHEGLNYFIAELIFNIFSYRIHFSDFDSAKIYIKPILLIVNAICSIITSLTYNCMFLPNLLWNSVMSSYLESMIE